MAAIYDDCDEDFEEESIGERLIGLTEAIPQSVTNAISKVFECCVWGSKNVFKATRVCLWVASTSALILVLPVAFENEKAQTEDMSLQQQREMLLGPNVAVAGQQTHMPPITASAPGA